MQRIKDSCEETSKLVRNVIKDLDSLAIQLENIPITTTVDLALGQTILQSNSVALELKKQQMLRRIADIDIICGLLRKEALEMNSELPNALIRELAKE
jgi:hypothetical protein